MIGSKKSKVKSKKERGKRQNCNLKVKIGYGK
jgi:hypothetical protein